MQIAGMMLLAGFALPAQAETVEIAKTVDLTYSQNALGDPNEGVIEFSETEVTETLGCSIADAVVTTVNSDNETLAQTAENGYWYNNDGEVCNWGTEGMAFFIEYRYVPGQFTIGFNGQDVDTSTKIGFMYEGKAIIFNISVKLTVTPVDYSNIDVVKTLNLDCDSTFEGAPSQVAVQFNESEVTSALDCTLNDVKIISLDADGKYIAPTATKGYWYNESGEVCGWGAEGMAFFIEYYGGDTFTFGFAGQDVDATCNVGLFYNGKAVKFNVTVKMTVEIKEPVEVVKNVALTYKQEAEGEIKNGVIPFTATDVTSALECELSQVTVVSLDEENTVIDPTANNGYWYNGSGEVCYWGTEEMAFYIEYDKGASEFRIGFANKAVDTKCNIGFMYENKAVMFEVTVNVTVETIENVDVVKTYQLEYHSVSKNDYSTGLCEFNAAETLSLLGCGSLAEAKVISLGEENEVLNQTANNGYWYDAEGAVIGYGEGCAWFIQYVPENAWEIGNFPGVDNVSGVSNIGFYYNGKAVMFDIKVTISDTEGVTSIYSKNESATGVYNLQGVKVADDASNLPKGFYIIKGKKVVIR